MKIEDLLPMSPIGLVTSVLSEDQLLCERQHLPVKNTFVHFDEAPMAPPDLYRLQTSPAALGISSFFEKVVVRSPGNPPAAAAHSVVCPPPPHFGAAALERRPSKSVHWAEDLEETRESADVVKEEKAAEEEKEIAFAGEKMREPDQENDADDENDAADGLGKFFNAKKGKRRLAGGRIAQHVTQKIATEEDATATAAPIIADVLAATQKEKEAAKQETTSAVKAATAQHSHLAEDVTVESDDKEMTTRAPTAPQPQPRWVDMEVSDDEEATTVSMDKRKKPDEAAKEPAPTQQQEGKDEEQWTRVGAEAAEKKTRRQPEQPVLRGAARRAVQGAPWKRGAQEGRPLQSAVQPARGQNLTWYSPPTREATAVPFGGGAPRGEFVGTKFLCRFPVGIEAEAKGGYRVCRRIFGKGGENMKDIARESNAKLRLRGRGSGFKEGPEMREADEPLMLCVSAENREGYEKAVQRVTELFEQIYKEYSAHCKKNGFSERPLAVQLREHPANPRC